ncbi:MAG: GNAT family N-acetyltransferase [Candidatus Nanoarchaeia archaeon]
MLIRRYKQKDREDVEKVHFETGFLGKSLSAHLSNNKLWKKNIDYYLNREPDSIFVLEDKGAIKGYILGCLDDKKYEHKVKTLGRTFKSFTIGAFTAKKDRLFWRSQSKYLFNILIGKSQELKLKTPRNAGHIHINLLPEVRGQGWGTMLLKTYEIHAKKRGVNTIYANSFRTNTYNNSNFWLKQGFKEMSRVKSLHWKQQMPSENLHLVCYSKEV